MQIVGIGNDMDEVNCVLCKEKCISNFEYICMCMCVCGGGGGPNQVSTHNDLISIDF